MNDGVGIECGKRRAEERGAKVENWNNYTSIHNEKIKIKLQGRKGVKYNS